MTVARDIAVPGTTAEYQAFAELIRPLSAEEWSAPTRCEGWTVGDVAAHVIGTLSDVVAFRLDGLGTPEVTLRQVEERRGRTPAELAEELDGAGKLAADLLAGFDDAAWASPSPGGVDGTLGFGIEALWYDTYVHNEDIRAALGRPAARGEGLVPSVSHIATLLDQQGWGPATLQLDGLEPATIGGGGDRTVTGDPLAFVLAATGRLDPATLGLDETVNIYRS